LTAPCGRRPQTAGMSTSPQPFAAVLFDLDGTLADTRLDFTAIRAEVGVPEGIGVLEYLDRLEDAARAERGRQRLHEFEMRGAAAAEWIDGAEGLLQRLARARVPTGILTRNSRAAVARTGEILDLAVDCILTREDCAPKPDPQGLLMLSRRLGVAPEACVYVGDFVYDLQAARNAGMTACLLRRGDNGRFADQADLVIDHLDELRALAGLDQS